MAPLTDRDIKELAGFTGEEAPVTSCYLDVDGRRFVRPHDYEAHLDAMVRATRDGRTANGRAAHASVEGDLTRMLDHVKAGLDRSHVRGLAMFSCSASGLWRVFELAVPVRNEMVVNHTPHVRQLESLVAEFERFAVLLADRQRARLFVFQLGELVEKTEQKDLLPRHDDDKGDLTKDQVAGHSAAAALRHLRRAAQLAFDVYQVQGFDHLVVGGPEEITRQLERELHSYLRDRIAARIPVSVGARDDEIRSAALEVEATVERAKDAREVARLRDGFGSGRGVGGLDAVLEALVARRVDTLLVSEGFEAPGWRCRSCAFVGTVGRSCPVCGAAMDQVADVVEEAVEEALAQSCRVRICRGNPDLDVLGRIGAHLRF